jgi:bifunctional DNA-binding transcriptional regulator/antitoxin component of YhaV-PrlF toxin-antitoxin module
MTAVKVQDCGCIALPDEIVEQMGLYPGSVIDITASPNGEAMLLVPVKTVPRPDASGTGAACPIPSRQP